MKVNRQDILFVLDDYRLNFADDGKTQEILTDKIYRLYESSKALFKMPDKLISLFEEVANYRLPKKIARKIVYDITCQAELSEWLEELQSCDLLKDKLFIDRKEYLLFLTVHDDFIVKTSLAEQKTYINGKFYYGIEEQDLLECYCGFVTDPCIYVLYDKRRLLSYIGLARPYLKTVTNKNKIEKLKHNKSVSMIFTNTELIYKK